MARSNVWQRLSSLSDLNPEDFASSAADPAPESGSPVESEATVVTESQEAAVTNLPDNCSVGEIIDALQAAGLMTESDDPVQVVQQWYYTLGLVPEGEAAPAALNRGSRARRQFVDHARQLIAEVAVPEASSFTIADVVAILQSEDNDLTDDSASEHELSPYQAKLLPLVIKARELAVSGPETEAFKAYTDLALSICAIGRNEIPIDPQWDRKRIERSLFRANRTTRDSIDPAVMDSELQSGKYDLFRKTWFARAAFAMINSEKSPEEFLSTFRWPWQASENADQPGSSKVMIEEVASEPMLTDDEIVEAFSEEEAYRLARGVLGIPEFAAAPVDAVEAEVRRRVLQLAGR